MHKGVVLLIKAKTKNNAESEAMRFLDPYGYGNVWDWYAIGGRWDGLLGSNGKNIVPLSKCEEAVREYAGDFEEHLEELKNRAALETKDPRMKRILEGYSLKRLGSFMAEEFCFECNVFNVEERSYNIPLDTEGYWAVVVDMHN